MNYECFNLKFDFAAKIECKFTEHDTLMAVLDKLTLNIQNEKFVKQNSLPHGVRLLVLSEIDTPTLIFLEAIIARNMHAIYDEINYNGTGYNSAEKQKELAQPAEFWLLLNLDNQLLAFAMLLHNITVSSELLGLINVPATWIYEMHATNPGNGYGTQLMQILIQSLISTTSLTLCYQPNNSKARNFYDKFNFVEMYSEPDFVELFLAQSSANLN